MTELAVICALQLAVIAGLMVDRARERREVARERADLLQRIQAPAHAVTAHHNAEPVVSPPAVVPDSDDDYWESREELAERLAQAEVNGGGGD